MSGSLPDDSAARNAIPMADGLLYYFPNALAAVAEVSRIGNEQHNPGEPMHWARGKSTDHENKIIRHLVDAGKRDSKGVRHSAYLAWRALALLQQEIERDEGAPLPRNARAPSMQHAPAHAGIPDGVVVPHSIAAAAMRADAAADPDVVDYAPPNAPQSVSAGD